MNERTTLLYGIADTGDDDDLMNWYEQPGGKCLANTYAPSGAAGQSGWFACVLREGCHEDWPWTEGSLELSGDWTIAGPYDTRHEAKAE